MDVLHAKRKHSESMPNLPEICQKLDNTQLSCSHCTNVKSVQKFEIINQYNMTQKRQIETIEKSLRNVNKQVDGCSPHQTEAPKINA